jgi:hypothetical protein
VKKPINKVALALGVLAVVYALLCIPEVIAILSQPAAVKSSLMAEMLNSYILRNLLRTAGSTIYGSGVLMGLGALVELADRIRWNAQLPKS